MSLDDVVKNIGIISRNNGVLAGMQASGDDARELRTLLQDTGALARETSERLMSLQRGQHASGMPARQRTMLNKLNKDFEFVLRKFQSLAQSSASSQHRPANNRRAAPPASSQDTLPSGSHDDPSATSERRGLLAAEQEEEQQVRRQRQEQIQARHNLPSAPMLHLSAWVQIAERLSQLLCELAQLACSVRSPPRFRRWRAPRRRTSSSASVRSSRSRSAGAHTHQHHHHLLLPTAWSPVAPGQTTVSEVNEIFIDLGRLVAGQTEQINTISSAIENTARACTPPPAARASPAHRRGGSHAHTPLLPVPDRPQVEQTVRAREELQLASRSKSRLRSRICCLMLGSIIVSRARRPPAPQARPQPPACASCVPGGAAAHHSYECTLVSEARRGCDAVPRASA